MPASEALREELSRLVLTTQAEERLPDVSTAVFHGGEVVWEEVLGLADAEQEEPATSDHQYRIGSITKTFTAAAVMQLRDAAPSSSTIRLPSTSARARTRPVRCAGGLGAMLFRRDDRLSAGHDGGMPGHVTSLRYSRREKAGSVVLMASSARGPRAAKAFRSPE